MVDDNVKELGDYAFYGANNIKTLKISEGATDIADQAIRQMYSLEIVILPSSATRIGFGTFYRNKSKDTMEIFYTFHFKFRFKIVTSLP